MTDSQQLAASHIKMQDGSVHRPLNEEVNYNTFHNEMRRLNVQIRSKMSANTSLGLTKCFNY